MSENNNNNNFSSSSSSSSSKPRVYQGVRVKTTVKELLQRHRAREANSKKLKMISQACLELQDLCQSTLPNVVPSDRYADPPSLPPLLPPPPPAAAAITAANASSSCGVGARSLQMCTAHYQLPDASSCSIQQLQADAFDDAPPHFGAMTFPGSCSNNSNHNIGGGGGVYNMNDNHIQNNNNKNSSISSGGGSLSPSHSFPLNWYYGLSSDADYYGHGTAPVSPVDFQKLCSPLDCNGYSPQDSFSSSSSSCYDSPPRMESSHQGFASELYQHQHYQHCNHQNCCCQPHCWSGPQDSFSAPSECTSYPSNTDYQYTCLVEESYRRELQMSPEMCYNVL